MGAGDPRRESAGRTRTWSPICYTALGWHSLRCLYVVVVVVVDDDDDDDDDVAIVVVSVIRKTLWSVIRRVGGLREKPEG